MSDGDGRLRIGAQTLFILGDEANLGDPVVDKAEQLQRGRDGFEELTVMRLRHASGCGHLLHTASEAGGFCANPRCRKLLCSNCAKGNLCAVCAKPVCGSCRKTVTLRGSKQMVCRACVWRARFAEPGRIVRRILWLALLLWLFLKFFGGFIGL